jgi:hypothetical protein
MSGKRSKTPAAISCAMQNTGECEPARCVSADAYACPAVPVPGLGAGERISPNPKCGDNAMPTSRLASQKRSSSGAAMPVPLGNW